jgi:serine/threonine-protein kinase RsbW
MPRDGELSPRILLNSGESSYGLKGPHRNQSMISTQPEPMARKGGQVETLVSLAECAGIMEPLLASMADHYFPAREIFAVRLSLEEALVNAIRHGNREDPNRQVQVRFLVTPERVLIEVQDEGDGFDPGAIPDPLANENLEKPRGRGLFLMRNYMTWVRYNARGNCVTMCKCRELTT